jgi:hypothetical protein
MLASSWPWPLSHVAPATFTACYRLSCTHLLDLTVRRADDSMYAPRPHRSQHPVIAPKQLMLASSWRLRRCAELCLSLRAVVADAATAHTPPRPHGHVV